MCIPHNPKSPFLTWCSYKTISINLGGYVRQFCTAGGQRTNELVWLDGGKGAKGDTEYNTTIFLLLFHLLCIKDVYAV